MDIKRFDNHLMGFEVIWSILYQALVKIMIASAKAMCNTTSGLFCYSFGRDLEESVHS